MPRTLPRGEVVSALRRARFGRILAAMRFLLFAPREGACSADGLARCGCELSCLDVAVFLMRKQIFERGCTGQIGKFTGQIRNHGFLLYVNRIAHLFENQVVPHPFTRVRRSGLVV